MACRMVSPADSWQDTSTRSYRRKVPGARERADSWEEDEKQALLGSVFAERASCSPHAEPLLWKTRAVVKELRAYLASPSPPASHAELCANSLVQMSEHMIKVLELELGAAHEEEAATSASCPDADTRSDLWVEPSGKQAHFNHRSAMFDTDLLVEMAEAESMAAGVQSSQFTAAGALSTELPASLDVGSRRRSFYLSSPSSAELQALDGEPVSGPNPWYIHPKRPFRAAWDSLCLCFIFYLVVVVPLEVCFFVVDPIPDALQAIDILVITFFLADIPLNFVTAFHEGHGTTGRLNTDLQSMAKNYLTGWFPVDFLASFPWYLVLASGLEQQTRGPEILRALRFARLVRLLKVLRILKVRTLLQAVEEWVVTDQVMSVGFQLLRRFTAMFLFIHVLACTWFAAASFQDDGKYTWLDAQSLDGTGFWTQYVAAFYFAVTTGTTIGYGDIIPQNTDEQIILTFIIFTSVCYVGHFLTQVASEVSSLRRLKDEVAHAKQDALLFMRKRKVPKDLQYKVLRYIVQIYEEEAVTALDSKVTSLLSESLQHQLALAVTGGVLRRFPLFEDIEVDFLTALCATCRTRRAGCGDIVVRENQPATEMFWVVRGEAGIFRRGVQLGALQAGDWFGELCLFVPGTVRTATIRCETHCEFVVLSHTDFQHQVDLFPHLRQEFEEVARAVQEGDCSALRASRPRTRCGL